MAFAFKLLLSLAVIVPAIHVFGHYVAARLVGVRVCKVTLGLGRKVVRVRMGNTDYCIAAFPVGCYLEMDCLSKSTWQRLQILLGGSVMNLLVAVIVVACMLGGRWEVVTLPDVPPVIGRVAANSPADVAGLHAGDRIVSIYDETIDTWRALDVAIGTRRGREIRVTFERMGNRDTVQMKAAPDQYLAADVGIEPDVYPVILRTVPGERADVAGVKVGDVVRAVDGVRMVFPEDLRDAVARKAGVDVDLTIARAGAEQHIRVTPITREGAGFIGVVPGLPTKDVWVGPVTALQQSLVVNYRFASVIVRTLRHPVASGPSPPPQGPIRIAQPAEAPPSALVSLLSLVAILSSYVGFLNLLPVPFICDGGRIVSLLLGAGRGRQETIGT